MTPREVRLGPRQAFVVVLLLVLAGAAFAWFLRPRVLLRNELEACRIAGGRWNGTTHACVPADAPASTAP